MDKSSAVVIRLPEAFSATEARKLRRELKRKIMHGSVGVIVDLSRVRKIDLPALETLLSCMEEVARQDGALQLGAVSREAAAMLELTRMDRLFRQFPAVDSEAVAVTTEPAAEEATGRPVQLPVAV